MVEIDILVRSCDERSLQLQYHRHHADTYVAPLPSVTHYLFPIQGVAYACNQWPNLGAIMIVMQCVCNDIR